MIVGVSERQCYRISADLESDLGLCTWSFARGGLAQSVGQFFVNFSPVTDREDPKDTRFAI